MNRISIFPVKGVFYKRRWQISNELSSYFTISYEEQIANLPTMLTIILFHFLAFCCEFVWMNATKCFLCFSAHYYNVFNGRAKKIKKSQVSEHVSMSEQEHKSVKSRIVVYLELICVWFIYWQTYKNILILEMV